jgi:peroxiredoxin
MKKWSALLLVFFSVTLFAQENTIPSVNLKTLDGKTFNTSSITNDGKPVVISFWATWCKPCIMELTAIAENYETWQKETGVVLYAVSIDDSKTMSRVSPFINSKGWEYVVLLDPNGDFKRALNVINVPHTFLVDGKGVIIDQHTSYAQGDEEHLYEKIKACVKSE